MLTKQPKIYVAGHRGMVGSAIIRTLQQQGQTNIVMRSLFNIQRGDHIDKDPHIFIRSLCA